MGTLSVRVAKIPVLFLLFTTLGFAHKVISLCNEDPHVQEMKEACSAHCASQQAWGRPARPRRERTHETTP